VEEEFDSEYELDIDDAYVDESRPDEAVEEESLFMHRKFKSDPGQKIMRLDQWLFSLMANRSRTQIKNAAIAGCIRVNGKIIKASYKVKPGDEVTIMLPHPPPPQLAPENVPVVIHYEDEDFIIVNKTPNMVVHPGVGNWTGTMLHGLLYHLNLERLNGPREEWVFPQLAHRIDKDTSGLLVVPKHDFANQFVSRQFYERTIDRLYNAIVWGNVVQDEGTIVGHVGRSKGDRKKFTVYTDGSVGKRAITPSRCWSGLGLRPSCSAS
jgi:23S rRNA pseudouridine1911/1915/1917 synthase